MPAELRRSGTYRNFGVRWLALARIGSVGQLLSVPHVRLSRMPSHKLNQLSRVIRESWSSETCDPADLPWSTNNPAKGQCGVSALVLNDLLGGKLILAEVHWPDGTLQGYHYWNLLPDGTEVDLTIEQFASDEQIQLGSLVERPPGPVGRCQEQYATLLGRVLSMLDNSA